MCHVKKLPIKTKKNQATLRGTKVFPVKHIMYLTEKQFARRPYQF